MLIRDQQSHQKRLDVFLTFRGVSLEPVNWGIQTQPCPCPETLQGPGGQGWVWGFLDVDPSPAAPTPGTAYPRPRIWQTSSHLSVRPSAVLPGGSQSSSLFFRPPLVPAPAHQSLRAAGTRSTQSSCPAPRAHSRLARTQAEMWHVAAGWRRDSS